MIPRRPGTGSTGGRGLKAKEFVKLFLGGLGKIDIQAFLWPGLIQLVENVGEYFLQFAGGILRLDPDQTQRRPLVEDHRQDDPVSDQADIKVFLLALVEKCRKLLFTDQGGQLAGGGKISRGQGRERGNVDLGGIARGRDQLSGLVDEEYRPGIRSLKETV